jgi:hypothetical protein
MPETLVTLTTLTATAATVAELADDVYLLLANDPPALDRRQVLGLLAHLSRTRELLQKVADWLADAGPAVVVDADERPEAMEVDR